MWVSRWKGKRELKEVQFWFGSGGVEKGVGKM